MTLFQEHKLPINILQLKKHIANFTTLLNLLCGSISIWFLMNDKPEAACYAVIAGTIFDFIDGFVARTLKITSELGKQLDSLSDVVTFGVAPSLLVASIVQQNVSDKTLFIQIIAITPLIANALFASIRLARFNIDTKQAYNFSGLPVPANALFFVSLCWLVLHHNTIAQFMSRHIYLYYLLSFLFSYLMISNLPLFGFKFKHYRLKGNESRIIFLSLCLLITISLGVSGLSLCVVLYILTSVIAKKYFL
jgi:CDP-diacylglycerol--serine O-phosphatidyltransferase